MYLVFDYHTHEWEFVLFLDLAPANKLRTLQLIEIATIIVSFKYSNEVKINKLTYIGEK